MTSDEHEYLSTGCLHGLHDYCESFVATDVAGRTFTRNPARCKFCEAPCICLSMSPDW